MMKLKLTKKQRFFISLIILLILLFFTRTKPEDSGKNSPASSSGTEAVIDTGE